MSCKEVERKEQKPIEPRILAAADLLASAVHDLKNPLSVIRGLGELGGRRPIPKGLSVF